MAKESKKEEVNNDCFVIMPITDPEGYDKGHFRRVYEDIIRIACEKAGFNPVRGDDVKQTNLIHLDILQRLIHSPMAICDLSGRNPNVLFELGLRQAFDKPTVLIQEDGTPKIFDISPLRVLDYRKELKYREVLEDQNYIAETLKATKTATDNGEGVNSIVSLLSLSSPATLKDITDNDSAKMFQVIMSEMNDLRTDFRQNINQRIIKESIEIANRPESAYHKCKDNYDFFKTTLNRKALYKEIRLAYDVLKDSLNKAASYRLSESRARQIDDLTLAADKLLSEYIEANKK